MNGYQPPAYSPEAAEDVTRASSYLLAASRAAIIQDTNLVVDLVRRLETEVPATLALLAAVNLVQAIAIGIAEAKGVDAAEDLVQAIAEAQGLRLPPLDQA